MINSYWEAAGFALMGLAVLQLVWLLGQQLVGDMREAAFQARVKRSGAQSPKVTVVVLADATTPVSTVLDSVVAGNAAQVLFFAPAGSKAYNKARRYRQKRKAGAFLRVLQRPAPSKLVAAIYARSTGSVLVVLDQGARLDSGDLQRITAAMADRALQAMVLRHRVMLNSTLASGLGASWQVLSRHFSRAYKSVPAPQYGLVVRKRVLRNAARRKQPLAVETLSDIWGALPSTSRQSAAAPRGFTVDAGGPSSWHGLLRANVSVKHSLLSLVGPVAILAALMTLGTYQGAVVLGFAALLLVFLSALAVWSEPKLSVMARINSLLLAPFAYIWYTVVAFASLLLLPVRLLK